MSARRKPLLLGRANGLAAILFTGVLVCVSCGSSSSGADNGSPKKLPVQETGSFSPTSASCPGISVYPSPKTSAASPTTQISFRNVAPAKLTDSSISVTGSRTGRHQGKFVADSDGHGASFYPTNPFQPGETVHVSAPKKICGASGRSAAFEVAKHEMHALPKKKSSPKKPVTTAADLQHFASDPALTPPVIDVVEAHQDEREGDFFLGPKGGTLQGGPMIVDGNGKLVWYHQVPKGTETADVRVAEYEGKPVLTWWQGPIDGGHGAGEGVIMDTSYQVVARVEAGNGYDADLHEFLLEPDGTAWLTAYSKVPADLSAQGGPENAPVYDGIAQQIDVATGNVLFEWHSLDHVDLSASTVDYSATDAKAYDYFHINAIEPTDDGTVLISSRNTSAVYLLHKATGSVIWTLGGKNSSFEMGRGTRFTFQHNARLRGSHYVTIFDNETGTTPARLLAISLDFDTHKASLVWAYTAPGKIPVVAQGNLQVLANGNLVSGWGSSSVDGPTKHTTMFTEYSDAGKVLFHARFKGKGINSYRAFRSPWSAHPTSSPKAKVTKSGDDRAVAVSWNGSTAVESWDLVTHDEDGATHVIAEKKKSGFETVIPVTDVRPGTVARALGANGNVLATTEVTS